MKVIKKSIEVISYFNTKGDLTPMKFRYMDENDSWKNVKVDKVISRGIEKLAGNKMCVFLCRSEIDDTIKQYEIKYEMDTCRWLLMRIQ